MQSVNLEFITTVNNCVKCSGIFLTYFLLLGIILITGRTEAAILKQYAFMKGFLRKLSFSRTEN